jgi:hypothetical protein
MSLVEIPYNRDRDPDGSRMRALMNAMFDAERAGVMRSVMIHAVAWLGIPIWLIASFPAFLGDGFRRIMLAVYGMAVVLALVSILKARRAERTRNALMKENGVKILPEVDDVEKPA